MGPPLWWSKLVHGTGGDDASASSASSAAATKARLDALRTKRVPDFVIPPPPTRCIDSWSRLAGAVLHSAAFSAILLTMTLYSLFGEDIRISSTPKADDPVFLALSSLTLLLFAVEMALTATVQPSYFPLPGVFVVAERRRAWQAGDDEASSSSSTALVSAAAPPFSAAGGTQLRSASGGSALAAAAGTAPAPSPVTPSAPAESPVGDKDDPAATLLLPTGGADGGAGRSGATAAVALKVVARTWAVLALFTVGSFYFWLDAVATVSMGVEIARILYDDGYGSLAGELENSQAGLNFARAARAARAGAQLGRLLRFFTMLRLVRVGKLGRYLVPMVVACCGSSAGGRRGGHTGYGGEGYGGRGRGRGADAAVVGGRAQKQQPSAETPGKSSPFLTGGVTPGGTAAGATRGDPGNTSLLQQPLQPGGGTMSHETRVGAALTDLMTRRVILGEWEETTV